MVNDSWPWKRDLHRETRDLEKRLQRFASSGRNAPTLEYRIERFAFLFAFITRKLLDSEKLSNELESTSVRVRSHPKRKRRYERKRDEHWIMEKYTFARPTSITLSLRRLCDILIHSKEFFGVEYDDRTNSVCFNSDRTASELYEVGVDVLVTLAKSVANDDVVYAHWTLDPKTGERKSVVRSNRDRPEQA